MVCSKCGEAGHKAPTCPFQLSQKATEEIVNFLRRMNERIAVLERDIKKLELKSCLDESRRKELEDELLVLNLMTQDSRKEAAEDAIEQAQLLSQTLEQVQLLSQVANKQVDRRRRSLNPNDAGSNEKPSSSDQK